MREVVIIDAVRSPIGRASGALSSIRSDDLLADVLKGLIKRTGINPALIEDVYAGCGNQAGKDNRDVARILTTLIHKMKRRETQYGLATLCVGVGQGVTTLVEGL